MNRNATSPYFLPVIMLIALLQMTSLSMSQSHIHFCISSSIDSTPISYAMLSDRTHNFKCLADEDGSKELILQDSTLIRVSAISYHDEFYLFRSLNHEDTVNIQLKPKIYELKEFVLHPYPTIMLFKKAIAQLQLEDSNSVAENLMMLESLKPYAISTENFESQDFITIGLGSPITSLYNQLSKRAKSQRKYATLMNADRKANIMKQKYNREIVQKLTGLKEGKVLEDFMDYCKPSFGFINSSSDYELAILIINRYQTFLLNHSE